MFQELRASLGLLFILTLLTGFAYPLLMTEIGQSLFSYQANGSLVETKGTIVGSALIGQKFVSDKYFHSRPSAAGDGYDAGNSSGSNLAPSAPDLLKTIGARAAALRKGNDTLSVPVDLVTASGSGLDPDISISSANFQAETVARARHLSLQQVMDLIAQNTTSRTFGILGENRVNVLAINQELDMLTAVTP